MSCTGSRRRSGSRLVEEIESFGGVERRRVYHLAFERRFRNQVLDALAAHSGDGGPGRAGRSRLPGHLLHRRARGVVPPPPRGGRPGLRDVRRRRVLRGGDVLSGGRRGPLTGRSARSTSGRGIMSGRSRSSSLEDASRLQAAARRWFGRLSHRLHVGTRTFVGGLLTGLLGSLATVPLLMRVLLPRRTSRFRRLVVRLVTPPVTRLRLERSRPSRAPASGHLGFSVDEMAGIVGGLLRAIGLTGRSTPLVVVMGHGSSSLNNPQEAAHDCGACGGAGAGPTRGPSPRWPTTPGCAGLLAADGLRRSPTRSTSSAPTTTPATTR